MQRDVVGVGARDDGRHLSEKRLYDGKAGWSSEGT